MPVYEHHCRSCEREWLEEYSLETFDWFKDNDENVPCVMCDSDDTYRCVTTSGVVLFTPGGVGWADNGYYQYSAYDQHQAEGKNVEIYERKEDLERVMKGERREQEKARLKHRNEVVKRHLGPDHAYTEQQANARIEAYANKAHLPPEKKK